jgi:hypothetical protein
VKHVQEQPFAGRAAQIKILIAKIAVMLDTGCLFFYHTTDMRSKAFTYQRVRVGFLQEEQVTSSEPAPQAGRGQAIAYSHQVKNGRVYCGRRR